MIFGNARSRDAKSCSRLHATVRRAAETEVRESGAGGRRHAPPTPTHSARARDGPRRRGPPTEQPPPEPLPRLSLAAAAVRAAARLATRLPSRCRPSRCATRRPSRRAARAARPRSASSRLNGAPEACGAKDPGGGQQRARACGGSLRRKAGSQPAAQGQRPGARPRQPAAQGSGAGTPRWPLRGAHAHRPSTSDDGAHDHSCR